MQKESLSISNMSPNSPLLAPNLNGAALMPFSEHSRYVETREPRPVRYEADGIRSSGTVVGFSDAGWHIVGDAAVPTGLRLALRAPLPHCPGLFCVPAAVVQKSDGCAFLTRFNFKRPPESSDKER